MRKVPQRGPCVEFAVRGCVQIFQCGQLLTISFFTVDALENASVSSFYSPMLSKIVIEYENSEYPLWKSSFITKLQASRFQYYCKWSFSTFSFPGFCLLFWSTYFKEVVSIAVSKIYFYKFHNFFVHWFLLCVTDFTETES